MKVRNLYTSYTLNSQLGNLNIDLTLGNCLFGSVKLTENADLDKRTCLFGSVKLTKNVNLDKHKHTSYLIGFGSRSEFLFTDGSLGKNVIIFGADMSSSVHFYNKNKDILIFGEGPTQRLHHTTLIAEAKYPVNFTESGKICSKSTLS